APQPQDAAGPARPDRQGRRPAARAGGDAGRVTAGGRPRAHPRNGWAFSFPARYNPGGRPHLPRSEVMSASPDRRSFLQASAALGIGGLGFLDGLPPVSAAEARLDPDLVQLDPEIEPLVRLLEDTPREKVLE